MLKKPNYGFAVIRRLVGSGRSPERDESHIDGCYFVKADAQYVFEQWSAAYPDHVVELVRIMDQKPPTS